MKYTELGKLFGFTHVITGDGQFLEVEPIEDYIKYHGDEIELDKYKRIIIEHDKALIVNCYNPVNHRTIARMERRG